MKSDPWFNRYVGVFDQEGNKIGVVIINLFRPDCFNWEAMWEKGYRALVI